jgi:hypothetical protein
MSGVAEAELRGLYGRYKHLALATGATLVLGAPRQALEQDAAELLADARAAAAGAGANGPGLAACVEAADELHDLLARGGHDVAAVRETHKRLRREVWKVIPCEYVPCCAAAGHEHE